MRSISIFLTLLVAAASFSPGAFSQEATPGVSANSVELSATAIEEQIGTIESDSGIDDLTRGILLERYREALESLSLASEFRDQERSFREALQEGPEQKQQLDAEIKAAGEESVNPLPDSLGEDSSESEIQTALTREQGNLSRWQEEGRTLESELAGIFERPAALRDRLFAAQGELEEAQSELEAAAASVGNNPGAAEEAEIVRLKARIRRLESELAMLEQEDASQEIRVLLLEVRKELVEAKKSASATRIAAIRELASARVGDQIRRAEQAVEQLRQRVTEPSPFLQSLEEELKNLGDEIERSDRGIRQVEQSLEVREAEREQISEVFRLLRRELGGGNIEASMALMLVERLRMLPGKQEGRKEIDRIRNLMSEVQREAYELERNTMALDREPESLPSALQGYENEVKEIRSTREILRSDLRGNYRKWIRELSALELVERQIMREVEGYREFTVEKLFWVRDSRMEGTYFLRDLRDGFHYCFGWHRWKELGTRLADISIFQVLVLLSVVVILLVLRPGMEKRLRDRGQKIRHISTNRFVYTLEAFFLTLALVLPGPLVAAGLGWEFIRQEDASEWSHGLGSALLQAGWFTLQIGLLIGLCRKGGLGEAHFQWDPRMLRQLAKQAAWLIPAYLPTLFLLKLVLSDPTLTYFASLGRFAGLIGAIAAGIVVARLLHPRKGVAALIHENNPDSVFGKGRVLWFYVAVGVALVQIGLLLSGFIFTGILLVRQAEVSATAILAAILVFGFLTRWFLIRERRLALEEALERRAARLEAARASREAEPETGQEPGDESIFPEVEEEEAMDLDTVSEQTRKLISFFVGIGLFTALWVTWTEFAPVLSDFYRWQIFGDFTLSDLALVVVVVIVVLQTIRNLPGLLEIAVLRRFQIDPGTRTAITTLANYTVIAMGAVVVFNEIGMDWSQFGWIAAALGVGIGFGLQEVVANFISGIILLFERPIRVGDVVTVDGIDGVVSRIQIRATTITNWDRKEFIVPNKNFITGTVLNWTLSNQLTRIVIPVGVAYGTDTKKAREILLSAAEDHERVLDDPAPLTTFESFDDSSLRLVLRCFLPDMENRLVVITELHDEIAERFAKAGIEIAFPQQDLHIRTISDKIRLEREEGS